MLLKKKNREHLQHVLSPLCPIGFPLESCRGRGCVPFSCHFSDGAHSCITQWDERRQQSPLFTHTLNTQAHTHTEPSTFEPVRMFWELPYSNWSWRQRLEFVCTLITRFIEVPVRCCAPLHQASLCDRYLTPSGTLKSGATALSPSISVLLGLLIDVALVSIMRLDWKWTSTHCRLEAVWQGFVLKWSLIILKEVMYLIEVIFRNWFAWSNNFIMTYV